MKKNNDLKFFNIKNFSPLKDPVKKMKRQATSEKTFVIPICYIDLISRI